MLGVALGALTRSTAAGAGIVVFNAVSTVATSTFDQPHLSTWGGFGASCAFLALVIALGAGRLRRGDA